MKRLCSLLVVFGLVTGIALFAEGDKAVAIKGKGAANEEDGKKMTKLTEIASITENKQPLLLPGKNFTVEFPDMPPPCLTQLKKLASSRA